MTEHNWIRNGDPLVNHEFVCYNCGRTVIVGVPPDVDWASVQPSRSQIRAELARSNIAMDCDEEKVRRVMES